MIKLENLLYIDRAILQVVKFPSYWMHLIIYIYIYVTTTCRNFCKGPKSTAQIFIYSLALLLPPSHYQQTKTKTKTKTKTQRIFQKTEDSREDSLTHDSFSGLLAQPLSHAYVPLVGSFSQLISPPMSRLSIFFYPPKPYLSHFRIHRVKGTNVIPMKVNYKSQNMYSCTAHTISYTNQTTL